MIVRSVDRWIIGFEKKRGVLPEDALLRWVLRRPLRAVLIFLAALSGFPFLFGLLVGLALGHWFL